MSGWGLALRVILACGATVHRPAARDPAPPTRPLVFAHRGASGYLPDHTLGAYALAVAQGADYIEPDLVMTADGVLVARHDLDLAPSTDAPERFPDRVATREVDGASLTAWFADDLTLAEIHLLRARQPRADRPHDHDGRETIPTWPEILAFAAQHPGVGLVPELKHPTYLRARGLDPVPPFLDAVRAAGLEEDLLWVQCFEPVVLRELHGRTRLRLVQLVGQPDEIPPGGGPPYGEMLRPDGLAEVARYADAIGVWKHALLPIDGARRYLAPTEVVAHARRAGLQVHVYTFRDEPDARPADDPDARAELDRYLDLGVDAVFADHPDTAVGARARRWP